LGWWFKFQGSPYERDCYLGAPLESQTTNPALVAYESTARLLKTEAAGLLLPGLAHAQEERG